MEYGVVRSRGWLPVEVRRWRLAGVIVWSGRQQGWPGGGYQVWLVGG